MGEVSKKNSNDIKVKSENETMKQICKNNDEKLFYIFVLICRSYF
ncbi:hypothetical protein [Campylobacter concisus]|nr:hypothetical protein [Campylobacter concisus]